MKRLLAVFCALALAMTVFALAGSATADTSSPATVTVSIHDFSFDPGSITVNVGDTVTWTNNDPILHSVTARNGSFDSDVAPGGGSFSVTFTKVGTYAYFCDFHPFMHGQVKVRGGED